MRLLVHEPMNTRSTLMSWQRHAGLQPHVIERRVVSPARLCVIGDVAQVRHAPGDGPACSGFVPHVTMGAIAAPSSATSLSNAAPASVGSDLPAVERLVPLRASSAHTGGLRCRHRWLSSGAIMPARAPASIDMLHTVMRPSMVSRGDGRAGVLDDVPGAAEDADLRNDGQDHVLRGYAETRACRRR